MQYTISGTVDVIGGSRVSFFLLYFDDEQMLSRVSVPVQYGGFVLESRPPPGASKAVMAFRVAGQACFVVRRLRCSEEPIRVQSGASHGSVVMIVLNEIAHDSRVLKTALTLTHAGYDVTLFGMWRNSTEGLTYTKFAGAKALIFPNPGKLLRDVGERDLKWKHMIAYLQARMWSYVQRANPNFIHTHDYHTVLLGLEFTRRLRALGNEVYWLHDIHDYVRGYDHLDLNLKRVILDHEAEAIQFMDFRFTVSSSIADWATEQYGLDRRPTVVLNAPLDPAKVPSLQQSIRSDLKLSAHVPLIVYTGGAFEMKGIHTVVSALATEINWHFAIVTDRSGEYIDLLKKIASDGKYTDRLHFLPYVPAQQVVSYLRDASVGILPFRRYRNGDASLPNKLYDYLHAGLPLVTSDCTLMKELVEREGFGVAFKAEDVDACAEAIRIVLADESTFRRNIASRSKLMQEYTWEEQSKNLLDAYSRFLSGSPEHAVQNASLEVTAE